MCCFVNLLYKCAVLLICFYCYRENKSFNSSLVKKIMGQPKLQQPRATAINPECEVLCLLTYLISWADDGLLHQTIHTNSTIVPPLTSNMLTWSGYIWLIVNHLLTRWYKHDENLTKYSFFPRL